MIVADASAVVELLLGGARGRAAERYLTEPEGRIHVPALLDVEVVQAFRRLTAQGRVAATRGLASVELLQAMPLERHVLTPLIPRLWELRANLTAYDAAYVALAEALACPLVTFDGRIEAAPGHRARVIVLES